MSNLEEDGTRSQGNEGSLDDLWGAEGGSEGVEAPELHDRVDPGFDNSEARDTLSESLEDPVDAIPRDPEGDAEPAPKKNSNLRSTELWGRSCSWPRESSGTRPA